MHRHAETRFCNFCGSTAPTDSLLASFEAIHFESRDPLTPCIVSLSFSLSCFKLCSKVLGHRKKRWYLGLWWPKFTFQPQKYSEVMRMHCLLLSNILKQVQNCSEHTGYYQTLCFFTDMPSVCCQLSFLERRRTTSAFFRYWESIPWEPHLRKNVRRQSRGHIWPSDLIQARKRHIHGTEHRGWNLNIQVYTYMSANELHISI